MKISLITSVSKILTYLCETRQKIKIKKTSSSIVYNILVVKDF